MYFFYLTFIGCTNVLIDFIVLTATTAYGVDAAFSYKYNEQHGVCDRDGLAICPGFTTTHVIPVWFPSLVVCFIQAIKPCILANNAFLHLHECNLLDKN